MWYGKNKNKYCESVEGFLDNFLMPCHLFYLRTFLYYAFKQFLFLFYNLIFNKKNLIKKTYVIETYQTRYILQIKFINVFYEFLKNSVMDNAIENIFFPFYLFIHKEAFQYHVEKICLRNSLRKDIFSPNIRNSFK